MATTDQDKRVALVTGASRGIGKAVAMRLAADGRHVVLVSRTEGPLTEVKALIEESGGSASCKAADIGDGAAWQSALEEVISDEGRLDIVVNNAGITRDNLMLRMSDDEWQSVIDVNLRAAFIACRTAARSMMRGKFGRIVNIGSTSGVIGNSGQANYAAAKAGPIGMTKSIARELGGKGITANVIAPGFIQTDMTSNLPESVVETVRKSTACSRLGTVDDIASAVSYVSSDGAGYLTGQTICVDGGLTMC